MNRVMAIALTGLKLKVSICSSKRSWSDLEPQSTSLLLVSFGQYSTANKYFTSRAAISVYVCLNCQLSHTPPHDDHFL